MEVVCRLSSQFIAIHPHILDQFDIASNQLEMICSDDDVHRSWERSCEYKTEYIDFYIEWIDLLTSIRSSIR